MAAVREGLTRAQLVPLGTAWADISAGYERVSGLYGRGELAWKPLPRLEVFGFGQVTQKLGTSAGVGGRVTLF